MAVVFELVLNLGTDNEAQEAAHRVMAGRVVAIRDAELPLAGPFVSGPGLGGYIEFSVVVPAIGAGGPQCAVPFDIRGITGSEVTNVGHQLYGLLRELTAYDAAAVGWDPEGRIEVSELEADLADGWPLPPGVVLSKNVAARLGTVENMEPFDGGHLWVPYAGDPSLWDPKS